MADTPNIYRRMLSITADMQTVAKNLLVPAGNGKYRAVSEVDVLDAVKPLEAKYGVYSYPAERRTLLVDVLETEENRKNWDTKQYETVKKTQFVYRIETRYRFVNIDNPGEYVDVISYGDGIDSADKAPGKAMTYSDKYALLKAYKIQTGDDPDQSPSPEYKGVTPATAKPEVALPIDNGKILPGQVAIITAAYGEKLPRLLENRRLSNLSDMSRADADALIDTLQRLKEKGESGNG